MKLSFRVLPIVVMSFFAEANENRQKEINDDKITIELGAVRIESVLESDATQLPYNRLVEQIFSTTRFNAKLVFLPAKRRYQSLKNNQTVCTFPDNIRPLKALLPEPEFSVIETLAVNTVSQHFFSLQGMHKKGFEALSNKVVIAPSITLKAELEEKFPDITFVTTDSPQKAVRLIKAGKAQAVADYSPDFTLSMQRLKEETQFSKSEPIKIVHDRFVCYNNHLGREVVETINTRIKAMKESGELKKILGAYYNTPNH